MGSLNDPSRGQSGDAEDPDGPHPERGYGDASHLKCEACGGRYDSTKHQMTCVAPMLPKTVAYDQLNSRQLAEKIFNGPVRSCYDSLGNDNDLEPEDREVMIQEIEGLLERHAGLQPDPTLKAAREENERNGIELS